MKIIIDNSENKIYVEESTNIGDLVKELNDIFPGGSWERFNIVFEPWNHVGYSDTLTFTDTAAQPYGSPYKYTYHTNKYGMPTTTDS